MPKRFFIIITVFFQCLAIYAQDLSALSAVELNAKGFNLYNEKKHEEALRFFRASFEKDPDYSFPHFNYACVLSILKRDREAIKEHLMRALFLNPGFRKKYFSDPDLEWFRRNAAAEGTNAGYFQFGKYKIDNSAEVIRKGLVLKSPGYEIMVTEGNENLFGMLTFRSKTAVQIQAGDQEMGGKCHIEGNLMYIELDDDIVFNGKKSCQVKKIILLCGNEQGVVTRMGGYVLLRDTLRPVDITLFIGGV